jgi:hypothetical protein
MQKNLLRLGFAFVLLGIPASVAASCAASDDGTPGAGSSGDSTSAGTGGSGTGGAAATSGTGGSATTGTSSGGGDDFDGGMGTDAEACAKFSAEAEQAPAAMLIVLDASASMNKQQKWGTAQLAIVSAIDKDVFDTMSLGLVRFPASYVDPPACLCNHLGIGLQLCKQLLAPGVSCGTSALPQIAIAPAGTDKSNAGQGVRHDIYQHLVGTPPLSNQDDGSPIYDALAAGYQALALYPNVTRRLLFLLTDGGFSCTSVASPARPGYQDLNACPDWEIPDTVNALIQSKHDDVAAPINTLVIGVPGSNSNGQKVDGYDTPPYSMRLALSTYAVSGSPETIDPTCDSGLAYAQNGADPAKPCHIDLSSGAFDATVLANAITNLRGKALGCVYDLPAPPAGETIDPALVNVDVTLDALTSTLPRRSDPNDDCALDGCWDYNAQGQVEILGKTCSDIGSATTAKVEIEVGCETVLK